MSFFQNTCKPKGIQGKIMVTFMNIGHSKLANWAFSHLSVNEDGKVLDIGCGGGANVSKWLNKCTNGFVTGIDYSEVSVNKTKKLNITSINDNKCKVIQGNVMDMPFETGSFNYVSAFETVYFWTNLEASFTEVFRVLDETGTFLLCNEVDGTTKNGDKWTKLINGMKVYDKFELKKALSLAGFSNITIDGNSKNWICIIAKK